MNNINDIDKLIGEIKSSPLYYLFLSSRELFHTNFWFWLSTLNKEETIKLFTDSNLDGEIDFKREHKQSSDNIKSVIDLLISSNKSPKIAIENKVLDFPTTNQLDRIVSSFGEEKGKKNVEYILTTLFWTENLHFDSWTVKTYKDISNTIDPKKFTKDDYYIKLIADYKNFIFNLSSLTEKIEISQDFDFAQAIVDKELFIRLNDLKLWEGYQKLRASQLVNEFSSQYYNEHKVIFKYGVNSAKNAVIDFVINLKDGYNIGIQIENNQYRKFITGSKHIDFASNLQNNNVFFVNEWQSPHKKRMLGYEPDFQYQYEKINKMSFKELFNRINSSIQEITKNLAKIESYIPKS